MAGQTKISTEILVKEWHNEALDAIREIGEEVKIRKGGKIRDSDLYFVREGLCALCIESASGKEIAIIHFFPGRLLNFMPCLLKFYANAGYVRQTGPDIPNFYIKMLKDSVLLRIDHQKFMEKFLGSLPMHSLIVNSLISNFSNLYANVFNMREMPAWQRIAGQLLENMSESKPHFVKSHITYAEIAAYLSLHPVTVAKIYSTLQDAGIIERKGEVILVLDPERLWRVSQGREAMTYKGKKTRNKG